jgi:hypothetical protein
MGHEAVCIRRLLAVLEFKWSIVSLLVVVRVVTGATNIASIVAPGVSRHRTLRLRGHLVLVLMLVLAG